MTNTTKTESPSTPTAGAASAPRPARPGGAGMERKWLMLSGSVAPAVSGGNAESHADGCGDNSGGGRHHLAGRRRAP